MKSKTTKSKKLTGLIIECDKCEQTLREPGALALSPPQGAYVIKFHLCIHCWGEVREYILRPNAPADLPRTGDAEQPKALPIKAQRE